MNTIYDREWLGTICSVFEYEKVEDDELITALLEGLNANKGHCPCVPKYAHNLNTVCPCVGMRKKGHCHCGLFKEVAHD